ncbi:hypothetical protein Trco_001652 [Trichoderma cornu-damae]|uniref:Uncharacterized protein n=1 Tax=Trichoderma cornu-damae TaxID=654480 RepID=A0A9P8U135_9HYPO|nr:hypothetical protein Trco_001652 [Trichoderma cornu-damae]
MQGNRRESTCLYGSAQDSIVASVLFDWGHPMPIRIPLLALDAKAGGEHALPEHLEGSRAAAFADSVLNPE